ncbi:MAG: hypothetical protein SCH70_14885 [Candidatus Methanoperedens sp.]|nr:hypothetical protein [Candidatus Methanoperedens sp.]
MIIKDFFEECPFEEDPAVACWNEFPYISIRITYRCDCGSHRAEKFSKKYGVKTYIPVST